MNCSSDMGRWRAARARVSAPLWSPPEVGSATRAPSAPCLDTAPCHSALGVRFTVPCRCHTTPSGAGANPSSGGGGECGGSEGEEAEINEVFLREEVMIKTSRVEPHANIKGHRMSKYRKGLYNKMCQHCLLKDGNQVETCILRWGSERITRVERGEGGGIAWTTGTTKMFPVTTLAKTRFISLITKSFNCDMIYHI